MNYAKLLRLILCETHSLAKDSYNFDWLGIPIIQFSQDMIAIQELIWRIKPDIIIETGIARGGSLILSASILHLLNGKGKVIGIDIRVHNQKIIEAHPLFPRIQLIEGSSVDPSIFQQVKNHISPFDKVMVILDSSISYVGFIFWPTAYKSFIYSVRGFTHPVTDYKKCGFV
jgi:cephalosporin hydroxylase